MVQSLSFPLAQLFVHKYTNSITTIYTVCVGGFPSYPSHYTEEPKQNKTQFGRGCMYVGAGEYENSILPTQFCYEPKIAIKDKVY